MMGTKNLLMLKTHFDFATKRFLNEFLYRDMVRVLGSVWFFVCNYVCYVFGLLIRYIFRSQGNDYQNDQIGSKCAGESDIDGYREEESGFHSKNSEVGNESNGERENCTETETASAASASKYEFVSGKGFSLFLEEPKTLSYSVQELYVGSHDYTVCNKQILGTGISAKEDFGNFDSEEEAVDQEKAEESVSEKVLEKVEQEAFTEDGVSEKGEIVRSEIEIPGNDDYVFDSEPESISSSGDLSMSNHIFDSITYEFLADVKAAEGLEPQGLVAIDGKEEEHFEEISSSKESQLCDISHSEPEEIVVRDDEPNDSDEEYIDFEPHLQDRMEDSCRVENKHEEEDLVQDESEQKNSLEKSEETSLLQEKASESNSDYENDMNCIWEHEDVIEQLKMELKNLRTGGLPTILEEEESETPKVVENLKPLKVDEKFGYKDRMEEIQKVYKSYAEKMRKLDVLTSQTMHAIGFLQLKDPVKSNSMRKSSAPVAMSLPQSLWSRKSRRLAADPMRKFVGELHRDLELVYVGQVCLSWEILHWQYGKAKELQEYDSQWSHQYNQVAGEFQLFRVLMQRFIENEPFQGPRVQNYVENRCVLRNLLQVPPIKDDCMKDNKKVRSEEKDAISSGMLAKIIEETMRVFWEFLCAEKDEGNVILKVPHQTQIHPQNPTDSKLLINIRTDFQKKEKRLKDIVRSGNCIVKRFQKHQDDELDHLLFFAQVELKLVSRVLSMPKLTTDQLVWCHEKLEQLNFVKRRIQVEPSFLLFPC